jgi:cytoskeletal protein CcmA (bactofilin family)
MKKTYKFFTLLLLLALAFLPTSAAHARGASSGLLDGRVIFGDNFTLESGDTLTGDLVVFGGNVTIEEEAHVQGDMVVMGGNVSLDGTVRGDVVIIGGSTSMGDGSVVKGDLVTIGGSLTRDPGAEVEGEVITNVPAPNIQIPDMPSPPAVPDVPTPPTPPNFNFSFDPVGDFLGMLFTAVAVSLLAMLASLFLQSQIERVSQAIVGQPVIAGSIGLLTGVMAPVILVILAVTIILIPVMLLAVFALALAWLFGLIAIGTEVGERFTRAINQTWAPPLTAGMGTFLMMIVVGGIGLVPCVGWLVTSLVALVGIGGVVLTLFGSQPYPRLVVPVMPPSNEPVG